MRLRVDLAYDGSGFHGWSAQNGLRSVQGELETWFTRLLRTPVAVTCAGRTDAGVHARGQVVHADVPDGTNLEWYARRLRGALPRDITIWSVTAAPPGFDARFSAIWRRYVYRLSDRPIDPLARHLIAPVRHAIDVDAASAAASALLGLHDFAAFCRARPGATTIRTLQALTASRVGDVIEVRVQADAFCHHMVRSLVGALVEVGTGRRDAAWLAGLLQADARCGDVPVMPALGLVLEEVGYPADAELAARAAETRSTRTLDAQTAAPTWESRGPELLTTPAEHAARKEESPSSDRSDRT